MQIGRPLAFLVFHADFVILEFQQLGVLCRGGLDEGSYSFGSTLGSPDFSGLPFRTAIRLLGH